MGEGSLGVAAGWSLGTYTRTHTLMAMTTKVFECEAVLFDLDGVLVDSTGNVERHWRAWAAEHDLDGDKIISVVHGKRSIDTIREVAPHLNAQTEMEHLVRREAEDTRGVRPIEGARELVASFPDGHWAVATSGMEPVARARLKATGMPEPPIFVTAGEVRRGKPAPDPYLLAAERLGVEPERCIVVEDSPPGIEAARAAGMRAIAVTTSHEPEELRRADAVLEHLNQLRLASGSNGSITLHIESE